MSELFVFLSGFLGGVIAWFPCGIGVAASRYQLGGAVITSNNKWVQLAVRPVASFSIPGQVVYLLVVLSWICIFFGGLALPAIIARVLHVPLTSPSLERGIYANFVMAAVAFFAGPAIWRKAAKLKAPEETGPDSIR